VGVCHRRPKTAGESAGLEGRALLAVAAGLVAYPLTKAKKRVLGNLGNLVGFYGLMVRWPEAEK
jgi:hypothetical protein